MKWKRFDRYLYSIGYFPYDNEMYRSCPYSMGYFPQDMETSCYPYSIGYYPHDMEMSRCPYSIGHYPHDMVTSCCCLLQCKPNEFSE